MIRLALKSEFSFKKVFMHTKEIIDYVVGDSVGVSDLNNCFSHPYLQKISKENNIKSIFSTRLTVVKDATEKIVKTGSFGIEFILIAKNNKGLIEINTLVAQSITNFYYRANLSYSDIDRLSNDVVVIAKETCPCRIDFIGVDFTNLHRYKHLDNIVYVDNNFYPVKDDRGVYECLSYPRFEKQTYPQHILTIEEIEFYFPSKAIENTDFISSMCEEITLPKAKPIKYIGDDNLIDWIKKGAIERGIDLTVEPYKSRIKEEYDVIVSKHYDDYFLVTADLIRYSKSIMLVGPARGSSGASLVAYCMGIVDINPLEFDLIFSRFLDPNRLDPPDIDTDFNDKLRAKSIKYLEKKYGSNKVKHISNISKIKARTAIGEFAKALDIPAFETESVKNSVIERSGGDMRAGNTIEDTLTGTENGKEFIEKYPEMNCITRIEGHARHPGVHAAGVIVCNKDLNNYVATGTTASNVPNRMSVIQYDKNSAEDNGLLKIDMLGLRTLTILQDTAELAGFSYMDYSKLPLDNKKALDIFNDMRLSGIFQFEGEALQMITNKMGVKSFDDISAITALGRPGAMNSGGTDRYIKYRAGIEEPVYISELHKSITKDTFGIIIYQESFMKMLREIAGFDWPEVSIIRRISSHSLGEDAMKKYKDPFIKGCLNSGSTPDDSNKLWNDIAHVGSWLFNKAHAVAYAKISYYCAWAKAHYPLEFVAANLNNAKSPESALRILRDAVKYDDIDYTHIDKNSSIGKWVVTNGKLVGSLTDLDSVGVAKAKKIIAARRGTIPWTPSLKKIMTNPVTIFSILYPAKYHWGKLNENLKEYGLPQKIINIENVKKSGIVYLTGVLISVDPRDINDAEAVMRRDGKVIQGQPFYINFKIEDDTGVMFCVIERKMYNAFHRKILEGKEKVTWYLIKGEISVNLGWKRVYVKDICNLNKDVGLTPYDDKLALENRNA